MEEKSRLKTDLDIQRYTFHFYYTNLLLYINLYFIELRFLIVTQTAVFIKFVLNVRIKKIK